MLKRLFRRVFGSKTLPSDDLSAEELKFLSAVQGSSVHPFAETEAQAETQTEDASEAVPAALIPHPEIGETVDTNPLPPPPVIEPASLKPRPTTGQDFGFAKPPPPPAPRIFHDRFLDSDEQGPAMVWLPGGRFSMGQQEHASADEQPVHPVTLEAFSIGQYPVTFAEYDRFCEDTGREKPDDRGWGREMRPVINITWREAVIYCEWLSSRTGQHYRLCYEAEWEYACRSGATTRYCFGEHQSGLGDYAWFRDNSGAKSQPVGEKRPNFWHLHDMHGNVWEWVADWLDRYPEEPQHNPTGPSRGQARVLRGGAWDTGPDACRCASRDSSHPALKVRGAGFRVAREDPEPVPEELTSETTPNEIDTSVFEDFAGFREHPDAPEMVYLPGGNFFMGSESERGASRERPLHLVSLDGFALGCYPVTVEEYLRFVAATGQHAPDWMDEDSSFHLDSGSDDHYQRVAVGPEQARHPVVGISHDDAVAYCRWLSELTGEEYHLPTEAQWEYACRAGTDTSYHCGDELEPLGDYAWFDDNSGLTLQEVGQKQPNAWGLYDMHGLVWEWVADWFGEYSADPLENPSGPSIGSQRVLRGGSWNDSAGLCRSAFRARQAPGYRVSHLGFRVARRVGAYPSPVASQNPSG